MQADKVILLQAGKIISRPKTSVRSKSSFTRNIQAQHDRMAAEDRAAFSAIFNPKEAAERAGQRTRKSLNRAKPMAPNRHVSPSKQQEVVVDGREGHEPAKKNYAK